MLPACFEATFKYIFFNNAVNALQDNYNTKFAKYIAPILKPGQLLLFLLHIILFAIDTIHPKIYKRFDKISILL